MIISSLLLHREDNIQLKAGLIQVCANMLHHCRIKVAILMLMVIFGVDEVSNFLARRRRPQRPARPSPERCIVRGRNIYFLVLYSGFCGPCSYAVRTICVYQSCLSLVASFLCITCATGLWVIRTSRTQ